MKEWEPQTHWPDIRWGPKGTGLYPDFPEWQESSNHAEELAGGSEV